MTAINVAVYTDEIEIPILRRQKDIRWTQNNLERSQVSNTTS